MIYRVFVWTTLLLAIQTHAYIYNDSLLLIYAKIVPKVMVLDHTTHQNGQNPKRLCILYEKGDRRVAKQLANMIEKNMAADRKNRIRIDILRYERTSLCKRDVSAFLLLKTDLKRLRRAIDYAIKNHLLTFAYDRTMLRYGAAISIYTGKKVYPVINIEAVKKGKLQLDPFLLQIAKLYDEDAS